MIKQQARVTQVFDNEVEVECALNSTCSSCSNESNCGVGTIAKAFSGKTQLIRINTALILSPGQWVTIATEEAAILTQAFITYLLPLFGLFFAGSIGQRLLVEHFHLPNIFGLLTAFAGSYLSFLAGRRIISRLDNRSPTIEIVAVDY